MVKKKKKKNNTKKTYKKEIRIIKAKQWLIKYEGSQRYIVRNYKKWFRVDIITAAKDLQELGVVFSEEYLVNLEKCEKGRIMKRAKDKEEKKQKEFEENYSDSDDTFSFIAGYTSGGAPFGTTWEELDLEPYASNEEIEEAYSEFQFPFYWPSQEERLLGDVSKYFYSLDDSEFLYKVAKCIDEFKVPYKSILIELYEEASDVYDDIKLKKSIKENFNKEMTELIDIFKELELDCELLKPSNSISVGSLDKKIESLEVIECDVEYHKDNLKFLNELKDGIERWD